MMRLPADAQSHSVHIIFLAGGLTSAAEAAVPQTDT